MLPIRSTGWPSSTKNKATLTSSQSRKRDGTPTLTSRLSCFVGESFTCAIAATSQRFRLHRHWLSLSPRVASQSGSHRLLGYHNRQVERECTVVEHASAFTVGNDLPTNLQTLFRCQSTTCILAQLGTNVNKTRICGCRSFLPSREREWVSRTEVL